MWWEERGLRMFEKKVLRKTFGRKREKVTMDWNRLNNEVFSELYLVPSIAPVIKPRRMILGACGTMGHKGFW
jgi:hypothetical protein